MLNLLPQEEKKKLITDYKLRFAVTSAVFACILLVTAIIGLLPTYLSRRAEMQYLIEQKERADAQNSAAALQEAERLAAENKVLADFLELRVNALERAPEITEIVSGILEKRTNRIALSSLEASGKQVAIRGVAATRADLISFHESLKQNPLFSSSALPISDLAKSVEAEFSITVTLP